MFCFFVDKKKIYCDCKLTGINKHKQFWASVPLELGVLGLNCMHRAGEMVEMYTVCVAPEKEIQATKCLYSESDF